MVHYQLNGQFVQAVDDVIFELEPGDTLGVIGESGCGKTTLAKSLIYRDYQTEVPMLIPYRFPRSHRDGWE